MATATTETVPYRNRADIEQRAAEVLRQQGLETIPVDPVVLANKLGMAVHNATFADDTLVGMIAKRGDRVTLLVNATDQPFRKRFAIAHELGHHFLHLPGDGDFVDREVNLFRQSHEEEKELSPERRQEIEANLFATALLMPEQAIRAEWMRRRSVDAMARLFNVSEPAMGLRIDQLGLE